MSYGPLPLISEYIIHQPTWNDYNPSFNFITLTVLEKSATKIYLMMMDRMTEGQVKSSITPLFQSEAIIQYNPTFSKRAYNDNKNSVEGTVAPAVACQYYKSVTK